MRQMGAQKKVKIPNEAKSEVAFSSQLSAISLGDRWLGNRVDSSVVESQE